MGTSGIKKEKLRTWNDEEPFLVAECDQLFNQNLIVYLVPILNQVNVLNNQNT